MEEQAILNIIKENPTIKQEDIAKIIGKSLRTIKARMIEMQEKNIITRKNGKRNILQISKRATRKNDK